MAITRITDPIPYAPAYNKNKVVCSSTNVAQPSFSFVFELYDGATLLSKQYVSPEPLYQYGVLDINKILESYVGTNFFGFTDGIGVKNCLDASFDFELKIGERYAVAGVMTEFLNLSNVSADVINASLLQEDFITYNFNTYDLNFNSKQFLTNTLEKKVTLTTKGYTNFLNTTPPTHFIVYTEDSSGVLIGTYRFANTATSTIGMFPSAPVNLNLATLTTGVQPMITSSVASYIIAAENAGITKSRQYRFRIQNCSKVTLHFLNDLGGFDMFIFDAADKTAFKFEKKYYKKDPQELQAGGAINYSQVNREWVNYFVKQIKTMKLTSDWISDAEAVWLRQMYSSPEIYAQIGNNLIALKGITELGYDIKQYEYNDLFNIELNIEFSVDNYRQRF
jgi:uncharacterized protein YnzC (UPF0291/DUF896 family)